MKRHSKNPLRWHEHVAIIMGRWIVNALLFLNRKVIRGEEHLTRARSGDRPIFIGIWHDRLIYTAWYLRRYRPMGLVSQSRDGDLLVGFLTGWGYTMIRGSSSRGSREALRAMVQVLDQPNVMFVNAMDGPVGPPKVAKVGGLSLAAKKGAVLIPISGAATRRWVFPKSWDKFQLPKPFGRIVIQIGASIETHNGLKDDELAELMGHQINQAEKEADAFTADLD